MQELFNRVLEGVRKQGGACIDPQRGPKFEYGNRRCALGHLLNFYKPDFEQYGLRQLKQSGALDYSNREEYMFLYRLQMCHDSSLRHVEEDRGGYSDESFLDEFNYQMKQLARSKGLEYHES